MSWNSTIPLSDLPLCLCHVSQSPRGREGGAGGGGPTSLCLKSETTRRTSKDASTHSKTTSPNLTVGHAEKPQSQQQKYEERSLETWDEIDKKRGNPWIVRILPSLPYLTVYIKKMRRKMEARFESIGPACPRSQMVCM